MDYSILKNLSVVFAEDDDYTREIMSGALDGFFGSIIPVKNGAEAYEAIRNTKPDILITDIFMPHLSGLDLIKKLQKDNIRPHAVFIATSCSKTECFLNSIRLKVDGYLLKPLQIKELFAQIITILNGKKKSADAESGKKLMNAISIFVGGKKIEIIKHLIQGCDEQGVFIGSYEDVMEAVNVSKPTVVSTFKQLTDAGLIERVRNRHYQLKV